MVGYLVVTTKHPVDDSQELFLLIRAEPFITLLDHTIEQSEVSRSQVQDHHDLGLRELVGLEIFNKLFDGFCSVAQSNVWRHRRLDLWACRVGP